MAACGGGGGGGNPTPTPPTPTPTPAVLTVTPASATVQLSAFQVFTATGTGVPVNWSVNGVPGGNATVGTITTGGLYTAPTTFPSPNQFSVTAVSQANAAQTASSATTVVYPNSNKNQEVGPIFLGSSGGNNTDTNATGCCIGTLGSLLNRGGTFFILSNNHVLAKSSFAANGEAIMQAGASLCFPATQVASLTQQATLAPAGTTVGRTGNAPSNVDAAIAQISATTSVDNLAGVPTGNILELGTAGPTSIAPAPPSATTTTPAAVLVAGVQVAKSGRTSGLTCANLLSASTDGITVAYDSSCGGTVAFNAVFNGQMIVNSGTFSAGGDSGSLIVAADTARPVGLLYAGNSSSTVANPIQDVITAFTTAGPTVPTFVGGADHAVSCKPTASANTIVGSQSAPVSARQQQIAASVRDRHAGSLMATDSSIRSVKVGGSSDAPGEAALVIELSAVPQVRIPVVIEGVRTKLVYADGVNAPAFTETEFNRGLVAKDAHRSEFFQPGFQGIGVGRSDDAPGETTIVIYTITGETHAPVPAVLDGVRTKVVDGERFRSSGWNAHLEPKAASCAKPQTASSKK